MRIVEMIIDESKDENGVFAISLVQDPAIESDFIALSKDYEIKFQKMDEEKRLLIGPALIPNKTIFRNGQNGEEDYYIYFSRETIEKTAQRFFKNKFQDQTTLEHSMKLDGLTVVESWIVEDEEKDKSRLYEATKNVPIGTWMVAYKVDNEDVWNNQVKDGKVKGLSVEGFFSEKALAAQKQKEEEKEQDEESKLLESVKEIIERSGL